MYGRKIEVLVHVGNKGYRMDEEKVVNQQRNEIKDDEQKKKVREKGRNKVNRTGGGKGKQKV